MEWEKEKRSEKPMKSKKMIVYRILIVGALLILQVTWLVLSLLTFSNISPVVNAVFRITSIVVLFIVINSRQMEPMLSIVVSVDCFIAFLI